MDNWEETIPPHSRPQLDESPLLLPAAGFAAGIAAGAASVFFPFTTLAVSIAAAIALLVFLRAGIGRLLPAVVLFALGFSAFFMYGPGAESYAGRLVGTGPVRVAGEVVRPPEERPGYTLIVLKPLPPPGSGYPALGRRPGLVRVGVRGAGGKIAPGDILDGTLELRQPWGFRNDGTFDWGAYALRNGIDAVAYADAGELSVTGNRAGPLMKRLYAFRASLLDKASESLPPARSAIFRAMILGDQGQVTGRMRDEFAASGTTHILSVSGSHVALLAAVVFFLVRWSMLLLPGRWALYFTLRIDARKAAAAAAIPASVLYCLLAGAEVATVRSVIMITVFLVAVLIDRERNLLNTLGAAALIVLVREPSALFDISFQLSYVSVLFISLAAVRAVDETESRRPDGRLGRLINGPAAALYFSLGAIAGTAPLVAGQFNSFSYVALPANLLVLPAAGFVVVPLGLLSALLYALPGTEALPLSGINSAVAGMFHEIVRAFASAPRANLHPPAPGVAATAVFYVLLITFLAGRAGRLKKTAAMLCLGGALAAYSLLPARDAGLLRVSFLDAGAAECSLVEFPDGRRMLIDCGGSGRGIDPARATVAPFLWNHGIRRLDYVVLTHPHPDHMLGLEYIISNFEVVQFWEGGQVGDSASYASLRDLVSRKGIKRHVLTNTGEVEVGGAAVQVLHTAACRVEDTRKDPSARQNNRSLVLRIKYGGVSFLFTGDAESEAQEAMLAHDPPLPLKSTVLKVPHHGSRDALDWRFLKAASPRFAVVSVGSHNRFGHPHPEVTGALRGIGAAVYRTDTDGGVSVVTDGSDVRVSTYAARSPSPASGWSGELANYARMAAWK